ncbi:hypothetical protein HPP92_006995 [Vanilla planifolia]|uniref:Response regulatory domain-containing protein n=1 Tax=Vanilla planifolia TaxID=51239 RepID=A0A835V977_VANPL|nr:hypothetical protein HPP92_006995 [Vanilla planifolia]
MGAEEGRTMALEREAEAEDEVRWEKLPSTPVRVLLVERDDSTRQIIAALLRKCGYGVTAASNGLKAWEILKEKVHDIDLVLTEVELPKISGVELLTMIMDHDMFSHISVINFLVKPIRKNELTNLWQHVWRKNKIFLSGDSGHGFDEHQDEKRAIKKRKIMLENDCFSKEYANHELDNKEYCEKESDAQSSCTISDIELESTCTTRMMEHERAQHESVFLFSETVNWDKQVKEKMDIILPLPNGEINGLASLDSQIRPEGKFNGQELGQDKSSTEKFDLLEAINNQSLHNSCNGSSLANSEDNLFGAIDLNQKSSSMPSLDLSLEIYQHTVLNKQENGESNVLRHSNSAFSLYNNNSRVVPALANPAKFQAQKQGSIDSSIEPSPDHSAANPVQHFGLISKPEDAKFTIDLIPRPDEDTFQSDPIRFIHFLVPVNAMPFNATGSNPLLQPIFYPQPALASWSTMPSMMQEAFLSKLLSVKLILQITHHTKFKTSRKKIIQKKKMLKLCKKKSVFQW